MEKYGILSFPFFPFPRRDSFVISQVEMIGNYVTVPMGISYSLAKKNSVVQIRLGAELIPNFLVSKKSSITFDTAYFKPTASEVMILQDKYKIPSHHLLLNFNQGLM